MFKGLRKYLFSLEGSIMVVGVGWMSVMVENTKTGLQLRDSNTPQIEEIAPEIHVLLKGSLSSFWRGAIRMGFKIGAATVFDYDVSHHLHVPIILQETSGVILGTLIAHPLDTVRTRQGATTFAHKFDEVDRNVSLLEIIRRYGFLDLFDGWLSALVLFSTEHIITRALEIYLFEKLFSSWIRDQSLSSKLVWGTSLAIAKVVLTPLEISKKRIQNNHGSENFVKALVDVYREEGFRGIWTGWYLGIPEAIGVVLIAHFATRGLARIIHPTK